MAISIHDYLIDQSGIDWNKPLAEWAWLLPGEFTIWLVNRFADLFIIPVDGTVQMLDVGCGTLTQVAESRMDCCQLLDDDELANNWLMIPLVDKLVAKGVLLRPGQCYGFTRLPVLGGDYVVENCRPISVTDYLGAYGSIHSQICGLPDGTEVVLKPINVPRSDPA